MLFLLFFTSLYTFSRSSSSKVSNIAPHTLRSKKEISVRVSGYCQGVVRVLSGCCQGVTCCRGVVRVLSGCCQGVVKVLSHTLRNNREISVRVLTESVVSVLSVCCQCVVRCVVSGLSGCCQGVVRGLPGYTTYDCRVLSKYLCPLTTFQSVYYSLAANPIH